MEGAALEAEAFLLRAKRSEVLSGLRDDVGAELFGGGERKAISVIVGTGLE